MDSHDEQDFFRSACDDWRSADADAAVFLKFTQVATPVLTESDRVAIGKTARGIIKRIADSAIPMRVDEIFPAESLAYLHGPARPTSAILQHTSPSRGQAAA